MSVEPEPTAAPPDAAASKPSTDAALGAALAAGFELLDAFRRVAAALFGLVSAEARVLRASVALVFIGCVALVAFSVSLWACVVALIGWALTLATHSLGIALAILVVLHIALVVALWFGIKHAVQQASFAGSRAELHALAQELRGHAAHFQRAAPAGGQDGAST
ncbi:MAG TPA: hypothetical protein VF292_03420 [Rhodanobacteraceae bacterium]